MKGSALLIAAKDGERTVGTARLVWGGGYTALIKDVLVLPEYQRQGVGTAMMIRIPNSSMDEGIEWLAKRPLKLKVCGGEQL